MTTVELTFEVPRKGVKPARPLSYNQRAHWATIRREMAPWRIRARRAWEVVADAQKELVHDNFCRVTVYAPFPDRRRRDPANLVSPWVKGMIDELVKAGAWVDDDSEHLTVAEPVVYVGSTVRIVIEALRPL